MSTIASIIRNRKGKSHAWRVTSYRDDEENRPIFSLYHYGTLMLEWTDLPSETVIEYMGIGHGSVSDQNGMNTAFAVLSQKYYYSRAGGAAITPIHIPLFRYGISPPC